MNKRGIIIVFLIFAFLGFVDATYLTVKHYQGTSIPCSILDGCDTVTNSRYAVVAGIPISLAGAGYYLILVVAALAYLDSKKEGILRFLAWFTGIGLATSFILLYIQAFVLEAYCLYCVVSAVISITLFIIAGVAHRKRAL